MWLLTEAVVWAVVLAKARLLAPEESRSGATLAPTAKAEGGPPGVQGAPAMSKEEQGDDALWVAPSPTLNPPAAAAAAERPLEGGGQGEGGGVSPTTTTTTISSKGFFGAAQVRRVYAGVQGSG